jgi:hypothetical protein
LPEALSARRVRQREQVAHEVVRGEGALHVRLEL